MDSSINIIPHEYPFQLIDKIVDIQPQKTGQAIKMITASAFWEGSKYYPENFLTESLAQLTGIIMAADSPETNEKKIGIFAQITEMNFYGKAIAGDTITLESAITTTFGKLCQAKVKASINKNLLCEGTIIVGRG